MYTWVRYFIIWCKFFSLFIGWEPTTWPANICLQMMVCSCAMSSNCVWLQIIFCSCKRNHAFLLLVIALAWKCRLLHFPKIFIKNKLGNQMIKQFLNSVIAKYHDLSVSKPKAVANNIFAQPRLIIVNKRLPVLHKTFVLNYWLLLSARGRLNKALVITNFLLIINSW